MCKPLVYVLSSLMFLLSLSPSTTYAWNGNTHKMLTQKGVEFLPEKAREAKDFFTEYRSSLFRGVVDADRWARLHHIDFFDEVYNSVGDRRVYDSSAADFSQENADKAIRLIHEARRRGQVTRGDMERFAELVGYSIHGIQDMHWFHTKSDEGAVHVELEEEVERTIETTADGFRSGYFKISFDGRFRENVEPGEAVLQTAREVHFGGGVPSADYMERSISLGPEGTGAYVGLLDWDHKTRKAVQIVLRRQANRTAEALGSTYRKAFQDPIEPADIGPIPDPTQIQTTVEVPDTDAPAILRDPED